MKTSPSSRPPPPLRFQSGAAAIALVLASTAFAATTPAASSTADVPALAAETPRDAAPAGPLLAASVEQEIERQLSRSGPRIDVESNDGVVTLRGEAVIFPDRQRAEEIASSVAGVREVQNRLSVRPDREITDAEIAEHVRQTLANDPGTAGLGIEVKVTGGVVTLSGTVKSDPQRRLAGYLASRIRGLTSLNNRIEVRPDRRADADIRRQLAHHYESSAVFDDDRISVTVNNGVVRLAGAVDSAQEKTWAQIDAWARGVREVDASDLEVVRAPAPLRSSSAGAGISDSDIREAIHQLYVYDPRIDSMKPDIAVENGVVTLSGSVTTPTARQAAVQIARHTGGVVDVIDRLSVSSPDRRADSAIAESLRLALRSNAVVDADQITVDVDEGKVVLSGTAADAFAKWTAGDLAERAVGVTHVENRIEVRNEPPLFSTEGYFYPTAQSYQPWFPTPPRRADFTGDTDLARKIRSQLILNPFTDAFPVDVSARHGVVTLRGQVDSTLQRQAAANLAFNAGAKEVINQLRVADRD